MSHELKTPLTAISGYAELIEHGMADAENSKRFAGEIHKNSVRLLSLINDIIQLSQLDGGKNHSEYADIDLYKLAAECVDMLKMNARKQNVTMKLCGKPCTVYADRQLMEELLYNLCDNAIRYNNRGGSVTVTVDEKDGHVFLSIRDTRDRDDPRSTRTGCLNGSTGWIRAVPRPLEERDWVLPL